MNTAAILRKIDAEIERLKHIRTILEGLTLPSPQKQTPKQKPTLRKPRQRKLPPQQPVIAPPELTILPPKQKREPRLRRKATTVEPRALSSSVPDKPVFVAKAPVTAPVELVTRSKELTSEALEAAHRQNLLRKAV